MFCTAVKEAEFSHEASQSGPITASMMPACIIRLIAAVACTSLQSTASQTKDTLTGNFLFASATAREIAPADARPSAQELAVGNRTAKFSTAQTAIDWRRDAGARKSRLASRHLHLEKEALTCHGIGCRPDLFEEI